MTREKELTEEEKLQIKELRDDMLEEMRRNDAMVRAIAKATFKNREEDENKKTQE